MKQPFYHQASILFTATADVSEEANSPEFLEKLAKFLKKNLGPVLLESVSLDGPVDAEPGDPSDLG